ncbi:MICAL-like protein 1 isoform X2 [Varroa jacobsoni]|uniref:MICAL-like protein 1 isoform X2 n=1 Tax=Varroa jacobsoni TaxID=62625 RepID=UPI000BF29F89|nr:MICAL-like protein 1 isoform X2 [Varroa jacobsoni]
MLIRTREIGRHFGYPQQAFLLWLLIHRKDVTDMSGERRGLSALQYWCQKATQGYPGVRVSDMSSSWRDGLAFCALIHHYRPDLIDFASLRACNILENNQLAFRIAEEQLGIPALLDAEDMEKYPVPDRLSIATYVSQFYQYFEGGMSRMKSTSGPAPTNYAVVSPPRSASSNNNFSMGPPTKDPVLVQANPCTACHKKVFLLERLIVGSRLYHRSCFRCCRCQAILSPGAYGLADDVLDEGKSTLGERYECTVCPHDEGPEFTKLMLKSELDVTRRRLESFESGCASSSSSSSSSEDDASLDSSQRVSSMKTSRELVKTPTVLAAHSSSGSEPELRRISDNQCKEHVERRPPLPRSPKPTGTDQVLTSSEALQTSETKAASVPARRRVGVYQGKINVKKPSIAPKPIALVTGFRKDSQQSNQRNSDIHSIEREKENTKCESDEASQRQLGSGTPKNSRTPSPTKSLKEAPICTTPDIAKFRENLRKTPTEADPLPERRLSVGSKPSDRVFSAAPVPESLNQTVKGVPRSSLDERLKKLSIKNTSKKFPANLGDGFQRTSSLRISQKSTFDKTLSTSDGVSRPSDMRYKGVFDSRLAGDGRSKSLSSLMQTSSSLSGCSQLILPDKPRPSPRKFDSTMSASSSNFTTDDTNYRSPYAGRRSPSPYLFMNEAHHTSNENSQKTRQQTSLQVPTTSPMPTHHQTTSIVKVESTTPQARSSSPDVVTVDQTNSARCSSNLTEVEKSPGPPKPKRGVIRKTSQDDSQKSLITLSTSQTPIVGVEYPASLNPFVDEDREETTTPECAITPSASEKSKSVPVVQVNKEKYPHDLNPFGDDEDDVEDRPLSVSGSGDQQRGQYNSIGSREIRTSLTPAQSVGRTYDESLNPFADGSDTSSLRRTPKKKAPAPPKPSLTSIELRSSRGDAMSSGVPIPTNDTPSAMLKGARPDAQTNVAETSLRKSLTPSMVLSSTPKAAPPMMTEARRKKRPAPSVPVPMRRELQAVSLKAIQAEMREIEKKQLELETRGKAIELKLRQLSVTPPRQETLKRSTPIPSESEGTSSSGRASEDGPSEPERLASSEREEELMIQLFNLVHEKNALYRRQAELMYIKRYQRLEEEQIELEYQIRLLLNKPPSQRTNEDDEREASLIHKLVEVVELRNEVVDAQEMDRRRLGREDEDARSHRALLMNDSVSPKSNRITFVPKKKTQDKREKKQKAIRDSTNSTKNDKSTIKRLFKEKYKTLKHGAASLKKT